MQVLKYLLLLFMLVMSHVAFASVPVFGTAAETKYARELTPPKGKAIIYIYQRKQDGVGVSPLIKLNKYEIGRIVPGSFTVWQLAPGRLELHVAGVEPVSLSLTSQAGKVYLFRLSVTQTDAGPKAQLESLPASYRTELAATQYIKNPRQVTPVAVAKPVAPAATAAAPAAKPVTKPQPEAEVAVQAGGMALLLKTGTLSLSKDTQTIVNVDRSFDKSASGIYAIEAYYQFDDGLALGGELIGYTSHFTTPSATGTGDVTAHVLLANVKQYYRTDTHVQPYLGVGLGLATTDVSGAITGSASGFAYQVMVGLEYRTSNIGVFGEAKYVGANTKSGNSQNVDVTGSGFFAGVAFHF